MPSDIEMTLAPSSTAQLMARTIASLPPPSPPSTLPISAFFTPRATPMRVPSTSRPKIVPAQCVPCPCVSPLPSPVKSCSTSVTPAKAGWFLAMPVSRTATITSLPSKLDASAFTAVMPQAVPPAG